MIWIRHSHPVTRRHGPKNRRVCGDEEIEAFDRIDADGSKLRCFKGEELVEIRLTDGDPDPAHVMTEIARQMGLGRGRVFIDLVEFKKRHDRRYREEVERERIEGERQRIEADRPPRWLNEYR